MMPAIPVRMQLSRARGFDLQAASLALNGLAAVNCARPSILGNPFHGDLEKPHYSRGLFVAMHKAWLEARRAEELGYHGGAARELNCLRDRVMARLPGLVGKNLACWCPLAGPYEHDECHACTLLRMANLRPLLERAVKGEIKVSLFGATPRLLTELMLEGLLVHVRTPIAEPPQRESLEISDRGRAALANNGG